MDSPLQTQQAVAAELNVSPHVLRRWTKDFAAQLSATAVGSGQYRYSAEDVKRLRIMKEMLAEGKTIEEVSKQLTSTTTNTDGRAHVGATNDSQHNPDHAAAEPTAVVTAGEQASQGPVSIVLREVLQGFAAGQEAILNSQTANRNLMGVVIQDNFNLKEENARLRERMFKLEQELNELRKLQAEQRQYIEQRMRQLEQKKDWLSRLLGF